jgi:peptidoglycan hydrolase-like protein with peptidoglycan-binding domain
MTTFLDKSPNTRESFSPARFQARVRAAQAMAVHFGTPITDGLRESPGSGSSTSLHLKSSGGLAFDFGGPDADKEKRLCRWAARHPELFQEVMHHDLGTGLHAHVAFESNLKDVDEKVRRALGTGSPHGVKAPKWPGRFLKLTTPAMEGEDVQRWQRRMDRRGWSIPTGGAYDRKTSAVCEKFQREKGLDVDGVVGRDTWRAAWTEPIT